MLLAMIAICGALIASTVESASSVSKKRTFGLRKDGISHVQLRAIMAPVKSPKSKRSVNTTVTVILTLRDNKQVGEICQKGPKLKDALMRTWYQRAIDPAYLYDRSKNQGRTNLEYTRTSAQAKEDKRLVAAINRAVGKNKVLNIVVVKGRYKSGGGSVTKLPFSSKNGCDELSFE